MIMQAFLCCSCNRTGGVGGPGGCCRQMLVSRTEKPVGERNEEMKKVGEGFKRKSKENRKKKRKQEKKKNIFIEAKQLAAQLHVWVA